MRDIVVVFGLLCCSVLFAVPAEQEPSMQNVFDELGVIVALDEHIVVEGPIQGIFAKSAETVEVVLVAKYSFGVQEDVSEVRFGYYPIADTQNLHSLFICGPKAGDQNRIIGLPAEPLGPYFFDPGTEPIGFFVQSANFNPDFSEKGETVYTQDGLNEQIERFKGDTHKARIYPYTTVNGTKPDWYILCWEFSTNNDYQDLITVVRGVKLVRPEKNEDPSESGEVKTVVTMR